MASAPLLGAVVVFRGQTDETDRPIAEPREMQRHRLGRRVVRIADRHIQRLVREVSGLDRRDAALLNQPARTRRVPRVVEHESADALRQQHADERLLLGQGVSAVADHQVKSAAAQHVGDALNRIREQGVLYAR